MSARGAAVTFQQADASPSDVAAPRTRRVPRVPRPGRRRQSLFPYALLAPILAFEGLFVIYPIIRGILLSTSYTQFGKTRYVGLSNFSEMIHDPNFWTSIEVTFEFTFAMVLVWLLLGLGVALLMNWSFKGRGFVRALLAIPWAVPDIPIALTFTIMLDPNFGVINRFASFIPGVQHHIQWVSDQNLALIAVIIIVGWRGFPFFALIILSSLQSIPDDLHEAARVDGAGVMRRFRAITLPGITPTLALLAVLAFIFSFQQFSLIYLTTGGGPGASTSTLSVLVYNQAFQFSNYNYASALAVVGLFLALVGTVVFVLVERRLARQRALELHAEALL